MKKYSIIANWKMFFSFSQSLLFAADHFDDFVAWASHKNISLTIAPSVSVLHELSTIFKDTSVHWAAQDCSEHLAGAFTGQVSAASLKDLSCQSCIIGHSERRRYQHELDEEIARKCTMLLDFQISPIMCLGEQEEEATSGLMLDALELQFRPVLNVIQQFQHTIKHMPVYIAYEPAWSIGTGKIADAKHLEMVYSWLRQEAMKIAPLLDWKFLYGGSVNAQTMSFFKNLSFLDGFLIGKASTNFQEFEKIVKSIMLE